MSTRIYAVTTSVVFALVALVHLVRLVWQWDVMIDNQPVSMWVSAISVMVAGFLSFEGYRVYQRDRRYLFSP